MFDQIGMIESMLVTVSVADNFEILVIESLYFKITLTATIHQNIVLSPTSQIYQQDGLVENTTVTFRCG